VRSSSAPSSPTGCGLYRKRLRAKGFHFKAVVFEFLGDAGKDDHLLGLQFHEHWHEQALALDALHLAVPEDLLEKHPFVCNVLIDDPQSVVSGGQNEGFAQLAERLEGAEAVKGIGGLFGFNQGSGGGGVAPVSHCAVGVWAAITGGWGAVRGEESVGRSAQGLRSRPRTNRPSGKAPAVPLVKTSLTEGQRAGNGRGQTRGQLEAFGVGEGGWIGVRRQRNG
jgi:hypothetical protein